jgi:hypothetical protein
VLLIITELNGFKKGMVTLIHICPDSVTIRAIFKKGSLLHRTATVAVYLFYAITQGIEGGGIAIPEGDLYRLLLSLFGQIGGTCELLYLASQAFEGG